MLEILVTSLLVQMVEPLFVSQTKFSKCGMWLDVRWLWQMGLMTLVEEITHLHQRMVTLDRGW